MKAPDRSEARVLRAFLVVFFAAALALMGYTWVRQGRACDQDCLSRGQARGELVFSGGGRLGMGMHCVCVEAAPVK